LKCQNYSAELFWTQTAKRSNRAVSAEYDLLQLGALFVEANFQLNTEFIDHNIVYVPRECNKQSYALAHLEVGCGNLFMSDFPLLAFTLLPRYTCGSWREGQLAPRLELRGRYCSLEASPRGTGLSL
jgi:hypothetical protein